MRSATGSAEALRRDLEGRGIAVDILVSCAGLGNTAAFQVQRVETIRAMLDVNVRAVVELAFLDVAETHRGLLVTRLPMMTADEVVRASLKGLDRAGSGSWRDGRTESSPSPSSASPPGAWLAAWPARSTGRAGRPTVPRPDMIARPSRRPSTARLRAAEGRARP